MIPGCVVLADDCESMKSSELNLGTMEMNKARRAELQKASDLLSEARTILEGLRDEEQEAFDNLPEGLQDADKGQTMQDAINNMEYAISNIEDAESSISDAGA